MGVFSRLGGTRVGVRVIGGLISPFQRWVIRTTRGRVTLTGKPVLLLTAIGRRSGQPRTVPLLYLHEDGNFIVCNVRPPGERRNPWPLNVRAHPEVTIGIKGVTERRRALLAERRTRNLKDCRPVVRRRLCVRGCDRGHRLLPHVRWAEEHKVRSGVREQRVARRHEECVAGFDDLLRVWRPVREPALEYVAPVR